MRVDEREHSVVVSGEVEEVLHCITVELQEVYVVSMFLLQRARIQCGLRRDLVLRQIWMSSA